MKEAGTAISFVYGSLPYTPIPWGKFDSLSKDQGVSDKKKLKK